MLPKAASANSRAKARIVRLVRASLELGRYNWFAAAKTSIRQPHPTPSHSLRTQRRAQRNGMERTIEISFRTTMRPSITTWDTSSTVIATIEWAKCKLSQARAGVEAARLRRSVLPCRAARHPRFISNLPVRDYRKDQYARIFGEIVATPTAAAFYDGQLQASRRPKDMFH